MKLLPPPSFCLTAVNPPETPAFRSSLQGLLETAGDGVLGSSYWLFKSVFSVCTSSRFQNVCSSRMPFSSLKCTHQFKISRGIKSLLTFISLLGLEQCCGILSCFSGLWDSKIWQVSDLSVAQGLTLRTMNSTSRPLQVFFFFFFRLFGPVW